MAPVGGRFCFFSQRLGEIDIERQKWTSQRDDMLAAQRNLTEFPNSLSIDIMVPIGPKGLMRGKLYHTNEILIGHSLKMFSQSSARNALEVCRHRLQIAEERLRELDVEEQMLQ